MALHAYRSDHKGSLATFERLPQSWPVHGTTGYNFVNVVNGVFESDTVSSVRQDGQQFRIDDTGSVNGMISNEGFFELQADDSNQLKNILAQHQAIDKIEEYEGKLLAYINQPLEPGDLNRFLFTNGICLNHLVKRKYSLEEQFLQLTSNQPSN